MAGNIDLQIDFTEAKRHLNLLDPNAKSFVFQTFDDSEKKDRRLASIISGPFEKCIGQLAEFNNRGAGVFVTVNKSKGNGRKKSDIICCRTVFREADMPNLPDLPIKPHLIIETSPGKKHEYLFINDSSDCETWEGIMRTMINKYGSDPNAKDRSRVLRLAGFYHCKGKPHLVRIIKENKIARYSLDYIAQHIPPDKTQNFQSDKKLSIGVLNKYGATALANELAALFSTPKGSRNDQLNRSAYALGQLISGGELEQCQVEQPLSATAISIGLSPNEVSATIRSGLSAGMANPRKAPEISANNDISTGQQQTSSSKTNDETDSTSNEAASSELNNVLNLSDFEYERQRKNIAEKLGVRLPWLDEQRKSNNQKQKSVESDTVVIEDEPWPDTVNGDDLMQHIVDLFNRYIVLPDGAAVVMSAWVILTFCYDFFRVLPIMGIVSPLKRCGKTTTLEVLSSLSFRALPASNITPAAVFRAIEKFHPTLLVDEADSFLKDNEELRGVLNSGHTKSNAYVIRCDGEDNDPKKFSTWGPKAIAAIGKLPDTITDRAILANLCRKTKGEHRDKINDEFDKVTATLRRKIRRWVIDNTEALRNNRSTLTIPENDRATDNWSPLAAIVKTIEGHWFDKLKSAAKAMSNIKDDTDDDQSILLLKDIREVFNSINTDKIFSADLVRHLNGMEERPWGELKRGYGLSTNTLARFLSPFKIKSKKIRIFEDVKRGYERFSFEDAFNRYLPARDNQNGTMEQTNDNNGLGEYKGGTQGDMFHFKNDSNHMNLFNCSDVPFQKGLKGEDVAHPTDDEVII